jgi:hypothetical protein
MERASANAEPGPTGKRPGHRHKGASRPASECSQHHRVRSLLRHSISPPNSYFPNSIIAIHGIGAHPDDTWCKDVGTAESPQRVNWLQAEEMLPAIAPYARIMRYGYKSQWFGKEAMRLTVSTLAQRLLQALRRERKVDAIS